MVAAVASVNNMAEVLAPTSKVPDSELRVRAEVPPEAMVKAPLALRVVLLPSETVPPPPWIVKVPEAVDTELAAAKLRAPALVKPLSNPLELFWKSSRSPVWLASSAIAAVTLPTESLDWM
jgi:hypothetical protein